jgi:hypothetical protein
MEIVYLIFFRVHQDCAAVSAGIINRVIAGLEYGRGTHDRSSCWRLNNLEWDDAVFTHLSTFSQSEARPLSVANPHGLSSR